MKAAVLALALRAASAYAGTTVSPYAPEAERAALRGAAAALTAAADRLAGIPLEKDKAGALAAALDDAVMQVAAASAAARDLEALSRDAAEEVVSLYEGTDREPGVQMRIEALTREQAVERARLSKLSGQSKQAEERLKKDKESGQEKDKPEKLRKRRELLSEDEQTLRDASEALGASEGLRLP